MKPSLVGTAFFTAVTATALLIGGNAQAVLIDDFNGNYGEITGEAVLHQPYVNAWGEKRILEIYGSANDRLSVELETGSGINGILWHENGDDSGNESVVRWGGGEPDLTQGGTHDRFAIEFLSVRSDDQFNLDVIAEGDRRSVDFTVAGPGTKTILFSEFGLSPSNFESVSQVELNITGTRLSSIQIDNISTAAGNGNQPRTAIAASSLPSSRSVQVGNLASVFATIINGSATAATDCSLAPQTSVAADFAYQTTDASNVPTGSPNTPASIPGNGSQNFIFGFAPTAPISPTEVLMTYDCANTDPAPVTVGLNTLLLSAEATPVPDIVALAATPTGDGIVNLPGSNGSNAFAVSTVNVGSTATITASAAPSVSLPLVMSICETNPATGVCLSAPAASATSSVSAGATPTYSVFVTGTGTVPFDAATNRIVVEFKDAGDVVRGSTSVAVRTQ